MADARPAGTSGKTSICDQRYLETEAGNRSCNGKHLPHPRPTLRAFIAYHKDISILDLTVHDGRHGVLFLLEDTGRALKDKHIIAHSCLLDDAAVGGKVAPHYGESSLSVVWVVHGTDDFRVLDLC